MTKQERLVLEVLDVSHQVNPTYTHSEHMAWALGLLADVVLQKNHMDNIVYTRLNYKLNTLLEQEGKYPTYKQANIKR